MMVMSLHTMYAYAEVASVIVLNLLCPGVVVDSELVLLGKEWSDVPAR